jgi:hypothetical protein
MRAAGAAAVLAATAGIVAFHGIAASSAQSPTTTSPAGNEPPTTVTVAIPATTITVPVPATKVTIPPTTSTVPLQVRDRQEIERQRAAAVAAARAVEARPQFTG